MSDYEKALVGLNDKRAGRSVPGWRFWTLWLVTLLAFVLVRRFADEVWVSPLVGGLWSATFFGLFQQYKRRSIR